MSARWRIISISLIIIVTLILTLGVLQVIPLNIFSIHAKPDQAPQKIYDYYLILDEKSEVLLMYVPLVVSKGDEIITEDNKLYRVVKIEENRAYARFVKNLKCSDLKVPVP